MQRLGRLTVLEGADTAVLVNPITTLLGYSRGLGIATLTIGFSVP